MFTGIVSAVGRVMSVEQSDDRLALTIAAPYENLLPGESVAVGGACLTVVESHDGWFKVEAIVTTRGRTRLGETRVGDTLNLERAMSASDRFGGHFVQGHVDGLGTVIAVRREADAFLVDIRVPPDIAELCVPHGSITVEGVSLTINALLEKAAIQVALIPYTLEQTTLGRIKVNDRVHLEADIIGKYVRQLFDHRTGRT